MKDRFHPHDYVQNDKDCKIRSYATGRTISISQESPSRTSNTNTKCVHRRSINAWQYPRPKDWPHRNDVHDACSITLGLPPETIAIAQKATSKTPGGYGSNEMPPGYERHSWRGASCPQENKNKNKRKGMEKKPKNIKRKRKKRKTKGEK